MERNKAIDILKFIAVLLITNSHFDALYPVHKELATGGAIGDVLFFFCSGYTLFMGRMGDFWTWYKRRIRRIYPSVLAVSLIVACITGWGLNLWDLVTRGGEWFVSCIMIYYLLFFFFRKYASDHLIWCYGAYTVVVLVWYVLFFEPFYSMLADNSNPCKELLFAVPHSGVWIYKWNYLKWGIYFLFFLLGAHIGKKEMSMEKQSMPRLVPTILMLLLAVVVFYGIQFVCDQNSEWAWTQIVSVLPLVVICVFTYRLMKSCTILKLYDNRYIGGLISAIGGLCLEVYLVQPFVRTTQLNFLFPLNLFILFVAIVLSAYFCRCVGRFIQQTFSSEDGYRWKEIVKV